MITKTYLKTLKQVEIAALLDYTERRIQQLHAEGLPRNGSGRGGTYDWEAVRAWYDARISGAQGGDEPLTDRAREQRAKADIAEIEAAQLAGRTMDRAEATAAWSAFLGRLRESARGIPHRAAPKVEPGMILAEIEAVIAQEVDQTLRDVVAELERLR